MRIATQVLNETAKRAHLPLGNSSLLNYINNNNSGSIVGNRSKSAGMDLIQSNLYERVEKNAVNLAASAARLRQTQESLFDEARESGSTEKIVGEVENFAKYFNAAMTSAGSVESPLNSYYRQMLGQAAAERKDSLQAVGISVAKDGTLDIDKAKLGNAGVDQLETLFGAGSDFTKKASYIAEKLADNANASASGIASGYSANGTPYSSYMGNNYDYFG